MLDRVTRPSPRPRFQRSDLAMIALGLVANGLLAIGARPLLAAEFLPPGASTMGAEQARVLLFMVPLTIIAAIAARRGTARAQIVARTVAWSCLTLGTVIAATFPRLLDRSIGAAIAVACVAALLALGAEGLTVVRRGRPIRVSGPWLLAIAVACSDLVTLGLSALLALRIGTPDEVTALATAPALLVAAGVMAAAALGLSTRRMLAVALNLLANVGIATLALRGQLGVSTAVSVALVTTTVVQGLLLVPLWIAPLNRRRSAPARPTKTPSSPTVGLSSVLSTSAAALAVMAAPGPDGRGGWLQSRAFLRGKGEAFRADRQDLRGIDLSGVDLGNASFVHADLRGADLHTARGCAQFFGAQLDAADLRQVSMAGSSLRTASLSGADLRDADLRDTSFADADLSDADLRGADLRGANLEGTDLRRSDLRGADLRGARLPWSDRALGATHRWHGALCPDGAQADPRAGCRHHRLRRNRTRGPDCGLER